MQPHYQITGARRQDLHLLPAIELAAAVLMNGHAPASVLSETTSEREFRAQSGLVTFGWRSLVTLPLASRRPRYSVRTRRTSRRSTFTRLMNDAASARGWWRGSANGPRIPVTRQLR